MKISRTHHKTIHGEIKKNPHRTAKQKLHKFMKSLTEDERREVWNIFYRQVQNTR